MGYDMSDPDAVFLDDVELNKWCQEKGGKVEHDYETREGETAATSCLLQGKGGGELRINTMATQTTRQNTVAYHGPDVTFASGTVDPSSMELSPTNDDLHGHALTFAFGEDIENGQGEPIIAFDDGGSRTVVTMDLE